MSVEFGLVAAIASNRRWRARRPQYRKPSIFEREHVAVLLQQRGDLRARAAGERLRAQAGAALGRRERVLPHSRPDAATKD